MAEEQSSSAIEDGKSLHQVFLQKGTDPSEVVDLIKSTVGHDYISPWSDADDASISAQFKAMSSQIAKVKDHKDIDNVDQCNATGAILKTILEDRIGKPMMMDGKVSKWRASMTDEQISKVENLDGVRVVRRKRVRRKAAATELVAISQPRTTAA
ncbi:hypothetical protein NXS19_007823 [Fusarium pseudograminearum]|nr:hypothetical protein NXS19_007823 [Fusarium pseudograminearum]